MAYKTKSQTKIISKNLKTSKQAENYQEKLYDKYYSVELIDFPRYSNSGIYTWKVSNK